MPDSPDGKQLLADLAAESTDPALPAFLSRPADAPVYHGFPLVEETCTDGWCYGAITSYEDPNGCEAGDGFVVAPDGTRAGLVWSVGKFPVEVVCPPTSDRCGVYAVPFAKPVSGLADLVECFRQLLPELQRLYAEVKKAGA
jgi:hypothetical protein